MNSERLHRLILSLLFSMMVASSQPAGKYSLAGIGEANWFKIDRPLSDPPSIELAEPSNEEKPTSDSQYINLYADVLNHKDVIPWKIPEESKPVISPELCEVLVHSNCKGLPAKVTGLPRINVGGESVGRSLFISWTHDPERPDVIIIARTTKYDAHFFRISPNGNLMKTAYASQDQPWGPVSNAIVEPIFNQDKKDWHEVINHYAKGK